MQFVPIAKNTEFLVTATSWAERHSSRPPVLVTKDAPVRSSAGCANNTSTASSLRRPHWPRCVRARPASPEQRRQRNLEISLMLDVTGSMCSPCTKNRRGQSGAKDLIDIVIWDDQSEYTSKWRWPRSRTP